MTQKIIKLDMFPSTSLAGISHAVQSVILSDVDVTHSCNKQEVEDANEQGRKIKVKVAFKKKCNFTW